MYLEFSLFDAMLLKGEVEIDKRGVENQSHLSPTRFTKNVLAFENWGILCEIWQWPIWCRLCFTAWLSFSWSTIVWLHPSAGICPNASNNNLKFVSHYSVAPAIRANESNTCQVQHAANSVQKFEIRLNILSYNFRMR